MPGQQLQCRRIAAFLLKLGGLLYQHPQGHHLFASLAAAIAYYVLADGDYADPWLAGLKAVPLLSLAVYAFLRHASLDAALLSLVLGLCALGDFGIEFDFVMGGIAFLLASCPPSWFTFWCWPRSPFCPFSSASRG